MKLICDGLALADATLKVIKAIATKTTNPSLEGIKLVAENDKLKLCATDLELMIEKTIKADVKIEGTIVVPGKFFSEYVRKLSFEQISLEKIENQLKISYTDSEGFIQLLNVGEFPEFKKIDRQNYFELSKEDLKDAITKTIFSASIDDARPILKGCLFEIANELTVVALDGYRLALGRKKISKKTGEVSFVVPVKSLSEITKLLDEGKETIKVFFERQFIMIEHDDTIIMSRLLDGEFINYKQIITSNFTSRVTVNKKQLEDALDRTALLARAERNNLAKFEVKDKILSITSNSEIGNIHENVTIALSGSDITTAFNARYFIECLKVVNDDFIVMNFTSHIAPCVITPNQGEDFLFLILPVRIIN